MFINLTCILLFFSKNKQKNLSGGAGGAGGGGESRLYKLPTLRVRFGFCLFSILFYFKPENIINDQ